MPRNRLLSAASAALLLAAGCIPYATGTTAATVPPGTFVPSTAIYFVPGGMESLSGDSVGGSLVGIDLGARFGLDGRSDVGVRFPGAFGIVLDYKRRVMGLEHPAAPRLALLVGGGVVNGGEHALGMAGLLASGRESDRLTPYGGLKAMHVLPLTRDAVRDDPTVGVFAGVRIGTERLGVSPELAVFHDRSALGLRDHTVIVVPSVTFHGRQLTDALFGRVPRSPPPPRRPPSR